MATSQNFEEALATELQTVPGLKGKVFPLNAPQGTKVPFIVYVSSDGVPVKTLDGFFDDKLVNLEINILHDKYSSLKSISAPVLSVLQSFIGRTIGDDGVLIQDIIYDDPVELYEEDPKLYRSIIKARVYY